jgi:CRISPR-associated protein Cas2
MLIVSYDISNNKTRFRFSKFLEKYGRRLQYSVFELKNSPRILSIVLLEIEKKFQRKFENSDSILIFSLCEGCMKKVVRYGYAVHEEEELVFM